MDQQHISPNQIKELRERTGVGMGKCKEALIAANGDIETAISILRKAGIASAVKKEGRETKEGAIKWAENDSALGLVEINAETDFVVKNDRFQSFANEVAQEIISTRPESPEAFLEQPYSKDAALTIEQFRAVTVQNLGEHIKIRRFEIFPKHENTSTSIYSHGDGHLVTMAQITGSSDEKALARDIAMHIAAEAPEYLSSEEIPERIIAHEREIAAAQVAGKPQNVLEKIVEGKLKAYYERVCLLLQPYVKDSSMTVGELVAKRAKETGKPLKLTYFLRWQVGESS